MPSGPRVTVWVAVPATAATARSKATDAVFWLRRIAHRSATPAAMPSSVSSVCSGFCRW